MIKFRDLEQTNGGIKVQNEICDNKSDGQSDAGSWVKEDT